jgi:hypothetical protein
MKKSYTKTIWTDSKTPVNSTNLGKIESALEYLYTNAFDSSDLIQGDGIKIETPSGTTNKKISLDTSGLVQSLSCSGIEIVEAEPTSPSDNKLYFVIDPTTKNLTKIMLGGTTIFTK